MGSWFWWTLLIVFAYATGFYHGSLHEAGLWHDKAAREAREKGEEDRIRSFNEERIRNEEKGSLRRELQRENSERDAL